MSTRFYQGKRELKRRFANILDQRPRKRGNLLLCATLTVAIICGAWTGCSVKEAPEDKSSQSSAVENRIRLSALYQYKMDSMETEPYESNIPIISLISELPTEGLELMEVDYSADGGKSIRIRYRITRCV